MRAAVATVAILVMAVGVTTVGVLQDGRMTVEVTTCGDIVILPAGMTTVQSTVPVPAATTSVEKTGLPMTDSRGLAVRRRSVVETTDVAALASRCVVGVAVADQFSLAITAGGDVLH